MKCPLCSYEFKEEDGEVACKGCLMSGACQMVKCPNCSYNVFKEPSIIKAFNALRRQNNGTAGKN